MSQPHLQSQAPSLSSGRRLPPQECQPLTRAERKVIERQRRAQRLREYVQFDGRAVRKLLGLGGLAASAALNLAGKRERSLRMATALHRGAYAAVVDRTVERRILGLHRNQREVFQQHIDQLAPQSGTQAFFDDPLRMLGTRALVLKSPQGDEKGVLALDYFFTFPLFAKFFDVEALAQRYHLLLEPSWSGYCELDLLGYLAFDFPVFVQNYEPRDIAFIERLGANLVNVPTAGNWWVDHRVFRPLPTVTRDADVLLIATWARYKRHDAFFAALARLRARGTKLKTLLAGYPGDLTLDELWRLARYHGVADQVEVHERISPAEVNEQLNRVKVNVLWSRREGFNRALIEGMFAGVPGILRAGFNYGYDYPYLNPRTGCFATEHDLPDRLLAMVRDSDQYAPREWVMQHMSPQIATRVVDETIAKYSGAHNEPWTMGKLAVKVTALNTMSYWDESDRDRFAEDYAFLRSLQQTR